MPLLMLWQTLYEFWRNPLFNHEDKITEPWTIVAERFPTNLIIDINIDFYNEYIKLY